MIVGNEITDPHEKVDNKDLIILIIESGIVV